MVRKVLTGAALCPHVQVSGRVASQAAQAAAARLGKGKATLALELVGFDADLSAAMQYAFGNAFVCKVSGSAPVRLDSTF
jgi:structural maintenance of chromosome 2